MIFRIGDVKFLLDFGAKILWNLKVKIVSTATYICTEEAPVRGRQSLAWFLSARLSATVHATELTMS